MKRYYIFLAVLLLVIPGSATVIHIKQRDTVYYGDILDLRGITGWTDILAWWSSNRDISQDPPDQFANITKYEWFNVTRGMNPGMWYQWYGANEKAPVAVFYLVPKERPASEMPTPTPVPTQKPAGPTRPQQPAPIADFILARFDSFSYPINGTAQVWFIGPTLRILGNQTNETFELPSVDLKSGRYTLLIQYPDSNRVFEVYNDGEAINSTWKGIKAIPLAPLSSQLVLERLNGMFNDTDHFHGRIEPKTVVVGDQQADITNLDQTKIGSVWVYGTTNLAKDNQITVVFDENRTYLASDLQKKTFTANVTGDDLGAMRIWRTELTVNLANEPIGNHFITTHTPDDHITTVPFYVGERFAPFEAPLASIRYINTSPFIPTPTPMIIREVVTQTVVQIQERTVYVNLTPDYNKIVEKDLAAVGNLAVSAMIYGGVPLLLFSGLYFGGRMYMKKKAAKSKRTYDDFFNM